MESIYFFCQIQIIALEYPGYGIYRGFPSEKSLFADAQAVYDYVINTLNYEENEIILIGRSLGSGPACYLAKNNNPGCLILISAFTSIRNIVLDSLGRLFKYLVKERFSNEEYIKYVKCPVMLIHGQQDHLISFKHSLKLHGMVKKIIYIIWFKRVIIFKEEISLFQLYIKFQDLCYGPSEVVLPKEMNHYEFDFEQDLGLPIARFLDKQGFYKKNKENNLQEVNNREKKKLNIVNMKNNNKIFQKNSCHLKQIEQRNMKIQDI